MRKRPVKFLRPYLTTRRAGAIAGIVFSILLMVSLILIWISVPSEPEEPGTWLPHHSRIVRFALNLLPFAGIAFLWFIGVLRDRIGVDEDRFFATVFLGSGLLFLAMLFATAAVAGGTLMYYGAAPARVIESGMYTFGRTITYQIMHVYAMKMAAVFMFSTSTLAVRTGIFPRWMAILGYVLATILLLSLGYLQWIPLVFPLWVILISTYIFAKDNTGADAAPDLLRKARGGPAAKNLLFAATRPVSGFHPLCLSIVQKCYGQIPSENLWCMI